MKHLTEEQLFNYAEGLLELSQMNEYEQHLDQCIKCREELGLYRSVAFIENEKQHTHVPATLVNNVMSDIEMYNKIRMSKARSRRTLVRFTVFISLILFLVFMLSFLMPGDNLLETPSWFSKIIGYINTFKFPVFNSLYIYITIPVLMLLLTERILYSRRRHKLGKA